MSTRLGRALLLGFAALALPSSALALEPPASLSLMDWLTSKSLADLLGQNSTPVDPQQASDPAAVQIRFLVNQCTAEFDPAENPFGSTSRIAEVMGIILDPAPQSVPHETFADPAPQPRDVQVEVAPVPLPLPRPIVVEPLSIASLPFQPMTDAARQFPRNASSSSMEADPLQPAGTEPQATVVAPVPATRPVPAAPPRALPQTQILSNGSFVTFAAPGQSERASQPNAGTHISPSILILE